MLKLTPKYTVSYNGVFHKAGTAFPIDPKDREEMERHGVVEESRNPVESSQASIDKPVRKSGRTKKVSA